MSIDIALGALARFQGLSLTDGLAEVERTVVGLREAWDTSSSLVEADSVLKAGQSIV